MVGILGYSGTATNSFSDNYLKAAFTAEISNYLDEVEGLEKTVGQDASAADSQCIILPYREKSTSTKC